MCGAGSVAGNAASAGRAERRCVEEGGAAAERTCDAAGTRPRWVPSSSWAGLGCEEGGRMSGVNAWRDEWREEAEVGRRKCEGWSGWRQSCLC